MSATFECVPLSPVLGAEVRCGDARALGEEGSNLLRRALRDHLVLLLRDQRLDDEALIAFGRRFGELDVAPLAYTDAQKPREHPEVIVISNVREGGVPIGVLGDGEVVWHSDNSYRETPLAASLLHALELPPSGGNTGFLSMYRALETLPPALRKRIDTLTVKHDATYNSAGQLRRGYAPVTDVRTAPGPSHPLVRTHPETGREALYLGRRRNAYVDGLEVAASEELLDALWAHATQPAHAWHHEWRVGDVVVWDNRCAMHRRDPFDPQTRRVMHRVQC